jgi:hypothetical protein
MCDASTQGPLFEVVVFTASLAKYADPVELHVVWLDVCVLKYACRCWTY